MSPPKPRGDVRKLAKRAGSGPVVCGFDSRHPYCDDTVARVNGPYVWADNQSGTLRRWVSINRVDGTHTTMTLARWAMAAHLGRRLSRSEHVHHVNEDALDDRIENYVILTASEHSEHHGHRPSPLKGTEKGWRHGTMYGWMKKHCTCDECAASKAAHYEAKNAARRGHGSGRGIYNRPAEHGTRLRYSRGCHCQPCRDANAAHKRALKARG